MRLGSIRSAAAHLVIVFLSAWALPIYAMNTPKPQPDLVIRGGRFLPITGPAIEGGTLVIQGGLITQLGKNIKIPAGVRVIDAAGCVILPGFFNAFTHTGAFTPGDPVKDYDEGSSPLTPQVCILDAIDPASLPLQAALMDGITAMLCAPGPGNVLCGQSAVIRPKGDSVEEMILLSPAGMCGGLGELPKSRWGAKGIFPMSRMGEAAMLRGALLEAGRFAGKTAGEKAQRVPTLKDIQAAALAPVATGELPLILHVDRLDDILTAIRIADELKIRLIIQHGAEAGRVADLLAKKNIPVLLGSFGDRFSRDETLKTPIDNAVRLRHAGVIIAFQTDPENGFAGILSEARSALASGLTEKEVLEALTILPARIFGLDDRIGSLDPGKEADIVIFDGNPLDPKSRIRTVILRGNIIE